MECPSVLQACHIKEWSACPENSSERLDPRNGLCMNALYHKAFDDGLFTVDDHCKVELSPHLEDLENNDILGRFYYPYEGKKIIAANGYDPSQEYLDWHRNEVFAKWPV